jgi:hypothetical protein
MKKVKDGPSSIELAARKMFLLRAERDALKRKRAEFRCRREGEARKPCWKPTFVPAEHDEEGRLIAASYWDYASSEDEARWCKSCQKRQPIHNAYRSAVARYGHACTGFWTAVRAVAKRENWAKKGSDR